MSVKKKIVKKEEIEPTLIGRIFIVKYYKLILLAITIIIAYYVFQQPFIEPLIKALHELGYIGIFIIGILFAFGFSAPFAVGFFITVNPESIFLASIIGGLGAALGDIFIFDWIKLSFEDEFDNLKKAKLIKKTAKIIKKILGKKLSTYLLYLTAGIIIASPLPDEIGISIIAGMTSIKQRLISILSFIFNTIGIFAILYFSSM